MSESIQLFLMVMAVVSTVVVIVFAAMYFLNKAVNQGNRKP